jgi:hypothetical protein
MNDFLSDLVARSASDIGAVLPLTVSAFEPPPVRAGSPEPGRATPPDHAEPTQPARESRRPPARAPSFRERLDQVEQTFDVRVTMGRDASGTGAAAAVTASRSGPSAGPRPPQERSMPAPERRESPPPGPPRQDALRARPPAEASHPATDLSPSGQPPASGQEADAAIPGTPTALPPSGVSAEATSSPDSPLSRSSLLDRPAGRPAVALVPSVSRREPLELAERPTAQMERPASVHITIGRVEVRAVPPARPTPRERTTPPGLSLDDYLSQGRGGRR